MIQQPPPPPSTNGETETPPPSPRRQVSKFASDVIAPRVRDMDASSEMDPVVISGLFENGLMGVEAPEEYGGSGLNFSSACIVVEEIAKVDPAVAVLVDIHNTLIINMLR